MKEVTKIVFEREDHIIRKIEEAYRLVGGQGWDADDPRQRPFRRIRGNDASREDCASAAAIILAEADTQDEAVRGGVCPFPELEPGSTRVADTWRRGILAGLDRARSKAAAFLEDIEMGLAALPEDRLGR